MKNQNLWAKFLLITIGVILVITSAIIFYVQSSVKTQLTINFQKEGTAIAADIAGEIVNPLLTKNIYALQTSASDHADAHQDISYIFITDPEGTVLAHTFEDAFPAAFRKLGLLKKFQTPAIKYIKSEEGLLFHIAMPALDGDAGVVHLGVVADQITKTVKRIITIMILIIVGITCVGSIVAYIFVRIITNPIVRLKESAELVGKGDLSQKADVNSGDEIGKLAIAFNLMVDGLRAATESLEKRIDERTEELTESNIVLEKEIAVRQGEMLVSNEMQGEQSLTQLCDKILIVLCKWLDVQIGALYISDEKRTLKLTGSYATRKDTTNISSFAFGEGVAGQVAVQKKLLILDEIPPDSIKLASTSFEAAPQTIVAAPLLFEGKVKGVLELGSFSAISEKDTEFIERVAGNIAIAINTSQTREQINELLVQTQNQAKDLEAQQGKLKASNEELEEQTSKLQQSERDLQSQQEELKSSNEELEEQTQLLRQSEEELKLQSEKLRVSNEELQEKQETLERQKETVIAAKSDVERKAHELGLASKYKSEFLANMSHELRTPLNSLLLLSKHLADNKNGNLDETEVEDANVIYDGGNDLLELINDIMDLSKVEAGMMSVNVEDVKIDSVTRNLQRLFNPVADERGLSFIVDQEESAPGSIVSDGQRLEQILKNLLSNAMKFTHSGSITLVITSPGPNVEFTQSTLKRDAAISFSVVDTGVGISADKQQAIFEAFQQQDGSTSRKYGGTGLGLTISKELAHLLGGEIQVSSTQGEGSTFSLYLPWKFEQNPLEKKSQKGRSELVLKKDDRERESTVSIEPMSVVQHSPQLIPDDRNDIHDGDNTLLIIEDDRNFARILRNYGRSSGFKCLVAGDGRAGIFFTNKYKPKGILLDVVLPDIDGYQVLEQLKFSLATRNIPIQIISGIDKDPIKFLKHGAIGHLMKPVSEEQLSVVFEKIYNVTKTDVHNILVIEDDKTSQLAIVRTLGNSDVKIKCVSTGKEGCSEILSVKYDCIILDLNLPDMSGFEVLKHINYSELDKHPPVIIYTGKEITDEEQKELEEYTDDIIIKGVGSPERLLDDVSLFLHKIDTHYSNGRSETLRMLHDEDAMLKDRKILLVDDDMRNTYALSKRLSDVGLIVKMASNGKEAVERLEKDHSFELILMDIMMPVMDGYEATRLIRKMRKYKDIPIVAITAKAMPEDRDKCLAAGASEYIVKPIDLDKLLSIIRIWLFKHT